MSGDSVEGSAIFQIGARQPRKSGEGSGTLDGGKPIDAPLGLDGKAPRRRDLEPCCGRCSIHS